MATSFTLATIDRLSQRTSTKFYVDAAATDPQLQAVVDALDAIILGAAASGTKTVDTAIDAGSAVPPADEDANRGNKWLMRVQDDTNGKIFTYEIGTADNAQLSDPTSDYVDLTGGVGLAMKTALETVYESPYGNGGVLLSIQQVTRKD